MIHFEQVSKQYRISRDVSITALDRLTCTIHKGEFLSVIGPSGSGKSTFLALIGLIDKQTSGEIWLDGQNVSDLSDKKRTAIRAHKLGFVYQFPSLIPTMTVTENVLLPKIMQGTFHSEEDTKKASEILAQVGLSERVDHLPSELSGGEQRRVALVRAIMGDPEILLADEPTGALDPESAESIMQLFSLLHQQGKTIILVTHNLELTSFTSRTIKIEKGIIV